ncbi:MAG: hypothetical protein E3J71_06510 [Candidatus Stahlbacteria bacterium]|nr:MAG: hypothetical protein E3J71_06510 [Candidatus Stahlbacteria bacterium]
MSKKTLLLIAAVAVMLAGATSAYGYYETWDGWFNSGYLTYDGNTFNYTSGSGMLDDVTNGSIDEFCITAVTLSTFTCASSGYYIRLWPTGATGWKYTGQSGQKEAYDGEWLGSAILTIPGLPDVEFKSVEGTWNTGDEYDDMYFNYGGRPPIYSAHWVLSNSDPPGITGGAGGSAGDRILYEE